jgi:ATP-dependent exoDNAse (exonuclease V) beta subunit
MINELCSMEQSKITKQNGNIAFEEEAHIYYDVTEPNEKFISVTTLIHSFTQPFDKEFWSAYKAVEKLLTKEAWAIEKKSLLKDKKFNKELLDLYNITENDFNREQQAVLDAWDAENRKSCERGTKIHADLENSFYKKKKDIDISKYHIGGKFECVKDYTELDLENGIYPEYLISRVSPDKVLRLAGQIDLLVKKGKAITIADWKTNKKIDVKSFFDSKTKTSTKMKYPLNHLDDCNYNHYTLQLSTYAWMIQQLNPEFVIEDLILVHFDHEGNTTVYHLPYLKEDVIKMLTFYKKEKVLNENKNKRKRIEY